MMDQSLPTDASNSGDRLSDGSSADWGMVQLVTDHHQAVYRYAFRLCGHQPDAEDLTQQTFMIAQEKLYQLRDPSKTGAWLFAILRSCYLKMRRKRVPVPAATVELDVNSIPQAMIDDDPFDQSLLQSAIDQLPDDFKLVLLMYYFEHCSYREIAEKLAIPIGTVMSRLSRAKSRLRGKLLATEASV